MTTVVMTVSQGQLQTRAELLATRVEAQIAGGEFQPGEMIGTLESLKQSSGFARSTVAEAIRLLSDRGVVDIRPGRGGGVYASSGDDPVVRLGRTLLTISGQPGAVADAMVIRNALEPVIIVDAARHRGDDDIRDLRAALRELADAITAGTGAFVKANWRLHLRIAEITPNVLAQTLYQGMLGFAADQALSAEHVTAESDRPWLELRYQVHHELIEAIVSGDTYRANQAAAAHQLHQDLNTR
jgi:GntR family transcriptional repressor for pyruvate dehydrogenase complex